MAMVRRNQELDLYQLIQTVLGEMEPPDYMYFVVQSLAIDDTIISTLPIIENIMKDKRWVIVMGEKSCVLKFIKDITLDKKMVFIHDMPFTLLAIINKNDINQKLFMQYNISYDEWREIQYIVVQSRKEMCYVQFFNELSFDFSIKKLSLFDAIRHVNQMIRSAKIVCCFLILTLILIAILI
jgi:hypothetical protein